MSPQTCELMLIVASSHPEAATRVAKAMSAARIACIVVDGAGETAPAEVIVRLAQKNGIAALIVDDAELARQVGADGVHLTMPDEAAYAVARRHLGPSASIGVDVGLSRHDAMVLGEAGADYVAFSHDGDARDGDEVAELTAWWDELFTVPCVAWGIDSVEEAGIAAAHAANFVAVAPDAWMTGEDVADILSQYAARIATPVAATA